MTKRKGLILVMLVALMMTFFAISVFGASITIEYYNGDTIDESCDGGVVTAEAGETVTLCTKPVVEGKSFNWYTEDGRAFQGGAEVELYESIRLYQIVTTDVSTAEEFQKRVKAKDDNAIRLTADIELTSKTELDWYSHPIVLLNGRTITIKDTDVAFSGRRAGMQFYGTGVVNFNGNKNDNTFAYIESDEEYGENNYMTIGRDVIINASNAKLLFDDSETFVDGYPHIMIYGKVTVKRLVCIGDAGDRRPKIEVFENASLTVGGAVSNHSVIGNSTNLIIYGGTITATSATESFFTDSRTIYDIQGGAFKFATASDYQKLDTLAQNAGRKQVKITVSGEEYTVVVPSNCEHKYDKIRVETKSCTSLYREYYFCPKCVTGFNIATGDRDAHKWDIIEQVEATEEAMGLDIFGCITCYHRYVEYVAYDPAEISVIIKVQTPEGIMAIKTKVGKVYKMDNPNKTDYIITDIKAFDTYTIEQIYGIFIPKGISEVNITTANTYVKEITFGNGCNATIKTIKALEAVEVINIEAATVKLVKDCTPTNVTTINSSTEGASVTFGEECFKGVSTITSLTFSKDSSYIFGKQCFEGIGIEELYFPDGASVAFEGAQAFYKSASLKTIYVGNGILELNNKPFDRCNALEKVVLMNVTSISSSAFEVDAEGDFADKTQLVIYNHATAPISVDDGAFVNRKTHGVRLYFISPGRTSFKECKYELHYGIPHAYELDELEPTCTREGVETYKTDCPCKVISNAIYKLYKSDTNDYETVSLITRPIAKIPHDYSKISSVSYSEGFGCDGVLVYGCSACSQAEDVLHNIRPMLVFTGYSVPEAGAPSIVAGIRFDVEMLKLYEQALGSNLEFGLVVAGESVLNGSSPLDGDGNVTSDKVKKLNMTARGYYDSFVKVNNLSGTLLDAGIVISGYIKSGDKLYYIQGKENTEKPVSVTYNSLIQ